MIRMNREQINKELHFANKILGDMQHVEIVKLVYEEEKDVVRNALEEYKSKLQDAQYRI